VLTIEVEEASDFDSGGSDPGAARSRRFEAARVRNRRSEGKEDQVGGRERQDDSEIIAELMEIEDEQSMGVEGESKRRKRD
jgi:hypothetical protein